ncbi:MAG TPA: phosphatidylglycerophosphatase A [Candidatus Omnitrophica bacterium]|nr:phosphatidylglycerophosphatase A [Candidatus Omnitrophota bacterium]
MDRLVKLFATFFYLGELPVMPGTVASLAGLLLYVAISGWPQVVAVVFIAILILGFFSAGRAEKLFGKKDAHQIVIDEVAGIFLVFIGLPITPLCLVAGFLVFRALDIVKPFPVGRVEKLAGSLGIMADDLVCGLFTNIVLQSLFNLNVLKV